MVCIMYESCLVIAEAETGSRYNVMVMASLATACIEETDNDKGLLMSRNLCLSTD